MAGAAAKMQMDRSSELDARPQRLAVPGEQVIAVVIPSYRVRAHILPLLARIGPEVEHIFVVDDACPEGSGAHVLAGCRDGRVVVLVHVRNQGVGGAVITGYQHAVAAGADVIVKLDGDGQMDPALIPRLVTPIVQGRADYVKGNRFHNIEDVRTMPGLRVIGNAGLSFMTKLSSGYWNIFDPTNGYTAISAMVLSCLPLEKVNRRYFFESDLLFRLGTIQAVVLDLPMTAIYAGEQSGLHVRQVFLDFLGGNLRNFGKRVFYSYFLRGFSIASLELVTGLLFLLFGVVFGVQGWLTSIATGLAATTGTVMLAALPIILGVQLLLSFLAFDFSVIPTSAITALLPPKRPASGLLPGLRSETRCGDAA
jgi:dolichol-phosphate mannosyltransferase